MTNDTEKELGDALIRLLRLIKDATKELDDVRKRFKKLVQKEAS